MRRRIANVMTQQPKRVLAAFKMEAEIEVTEMKRRTPVDITENAPHPGNLRNSLHAEEPMYNGRTYEIIIASGNQAPYAIYVHENPDAYHPIGQWKFMESVLNESRPYMGSRVARRIKL
jgi:hypothetical protein